MAYMDMAKSGFYIHFIPKYENYSKITRFIEIEDVESCHSNCEMFIVNDKVFSQWKEQEPEKNGVCAFI